MEQKKWMERQIEKATEDVKGRPAWMKEIAKLEGASRYRVHEAQRAVRTTTSPKFKKKG